MITHISISNFAIIKNTELDLQEGLNIITGETGSGKSIVIEAINLVLGGRADSSYVRHGSEKAVIQMLAEADGEEFSVSREISAVGKNVCRINGNLATRAEVAHAMIHVADIHGQYDNVKLLDPDNHLALLDEYRKERVQPAKLAFRTSYEAYKSAHQQLSDLLRKEREIQKNADFFRFELAEIEDARPQPGEDQELENRISLLKNSEQIYGAAGAAEQALTGSDASALTLVGEALHQLGSIRNVSKETGELESRMESVYYDLTDLSERIRDLLEKTNFEPAEVDRAIARLDLLEQLKKKHGGSIEAVLAEEEVLRDRLESLETFDSSRAELEAESKKALAELRANAAQLTAIRKENAEELSKAIEAELQDLNFQDARFLVEVRPAKAISSSGQDECEILIGLNRGEPMKPLSKTASGGEISRIMLAIKNVTGDYDQVPTMIFDEIDTGISGKTASVVARKLKEISKKHQILCITHLPQIAAAADHSYRIYKDTDENETYTHIERLQDDARIDEIARLLSGDHVTETARENARELITRFR